MCPVCASLVQSQAYLLYILRALWLVWMQSHRLGEVCRHVKILYTHLYSEVNYFYACWGYFFQRFFLLQEINANADFPSGEYKGRSCCSNHLWKVRFGLNLERKASLQQDSQETARQTCPNLCPALSKATEKLLLKHKQMVWDVELLLYKNPFSLEKKWLRESIKEINKVKCGLEKTKLSVA